MLPLLIGLLVAVGPLLRGSWDFWAQALLFLAFLVGSAAWLAGRVAVGYVPLPDRRLALWSAALIFLAALSAALSPVPDAAWTGWRTLTLGLVLFPAITAVSKDERAAIDEALRFAAWILVILAFYQRYREGLPRPPSAFINQNVFAGTILMLLPLAAQKRDWFLSAGLLICLAWTRSVGAWLGLSAALILSRRQTGLVGYWAGAAAGFVCLVAIYAKLQSPEVLHRWAWWAAAARMAAERPWFGFGPGSFAYALTVHQPGGSELNAFYAHQHFLETAAELGVPYLLVWAAGLVQLLRRGGSHKRFGAVAILVQSLWDYALSIPANYWLFCYFAASSAPQTSRGVNVPMRRKAPVIAAVVACAVVGFGWVRTLWRADRLKAAADERFADGAPASEVHALLERSLALAPDAQAERLAAEMDLKRIVDGDLPGREGAREAAAHLERSVARNPFRPSSWSALERLYTQLGDADAARRTRARAAALGS